MALSDIQTPYYDAIAEWLADDVGNSLGGNYFVDIFDAVRFAFHGNSVSNDNSNLKTHRRLVYIKPPESDGGGYQDIGWKWSDQLVISESFGVVICGPNIAFSEINNASGQNTIAFARTNATLIYYDIADTTTPLLLCKTGGVRIENLYFRGSASTANDAPDTCLQFVEGTGIGTRGYHIVWCSFQHFGTAIDFGGDGSANCDTALVQYCSFDCPEGVKLSHSQAQLFHMDTCENNYSGATWINNTEGVGPCLVENCGIVTPNQVVMYLGGTSTNNGTWTFRHCKFDTQSIGSVLIEMHTGDSEDTDGEILIDDVKDSRVLDSNVPTSATEKIAKIYGQVHLTLRNVNGVGKIQVTGDAVNGRMPSILIDDCVFAREAERDNPRTLLVRADGSQAVQGVDYSTLEVRSCKRRGNSMRYADDIPERAVYVDGEAYNQTDGAKGNIVWL